MLPLLCSMSLISPNFDVKSIIFSQFGTGLLPKLLEKSLGALFRVYNKIFFFFFSSKNICSGYSIEPAQ